ncbi:hypothetical protein HUJ05_008265 [Dendroctonus ponderosae]|nr:hypothetical protein HUJ05_008265 [Dendroctonus ponderosae]
MYPLLTIGTFEGTMKFFGEHKNGDLRVFKVGFPLSGWSIFFRPASTIHTKAKWKNSQFFEQKLSMPTNRLNAAAFFRSKTLSMCKCIRSQTEVNTAMQGNASVQGCRKTRLATAAGHLQQCF